MDLGSVDSLAEKHPEILASKEVVTFLAGNYVERNGKKIGPFKHLTNERNRLSGLVWQNFDVVQYSPTIGAEIHGVDITTELAQPVVDELRQALLAYKVIFFRDQPLTPERHVAFARRFGELDINPFIPPNPDFPELTRFEKGVEVGGYENTWHSDASWQETPPLGAILHAVHVPKCGGDTLFVDTHAVYEGLNTEIKKMIEYLDAEHDFSKAFGAQVPKNKKEEIRQKYPIVTHPLVVRHPETDRKHLYNNPMFTERIIGLSPEESEGLSTMLWHENENPEYQCRFRWEPHSVAFWDNRACQHYASSDYWPEVRIMERAAIAGTKPVR